MAGWSLMGTVDWDEWWLLHDLPNRPHPPSPKPSPGAASTAHLCTSIFPILMPLQQARSAFSIDSPLRMMLTPHSFLAKSTPTYLQETIRTLGWGRAQPGRLSPSACAVALPDGMQPQQCCTWRVLLPGAGRAHRRQPHACEAPCCQLSVQTADALVAGGREHNPL